MSRVYNFSAGPAVLPEEVLREAAAEMLDYQGTGMSVMEMSHRSKAFQSIIDDAEKDLRELMEIPEEEVPLANPDVPKTGDISGIWYTMTFLAAAGLVFITILARKNQEEAQEN